MCENKGLGKRGEEVPPSRHMVAGNPFGADMKHTLGTSQNIWRDL